MNMGAGRPSRFLRRTLSMLLAALASIVDLRPARIPRIEDFAGSRHDLRRPRASLRRPGTGDSDSSSRTDTGDGHSVRLWSAMAAIAL
jgi:hypothetical protein